MAGICSNVGIVPLAVSGIEDHVHSLVELPPTMSLSKALNLLKTNSSGWMGDQQRGFHWQEGYGAFAVSVSQLATVKRYVLNQEAHHRNRTFEDEYIALLEKHGVQYDPRYIFD
jgi:REP element-mobilizing transposase RayT